MEKKRVLAITKSDMLDEELEEALKAELPEGIPSVFISSITQKGLVELKDLLWRELDTENFHEVEHIVHKNLDVSTLAFEDDDFVVPLMDDDDFDDDDFEEYDWDDEDDKS